MNGWIKVHRRDSWIWTMPASWFRVMFELIRRARWGPGPGKVTVDGKVIEMPVGSTFASIRGLAEDLKLNAKTVKQAFDLLLSEGFMTRDRYNRRTIYHITNYARYQSHDDENGTRHGTRGGTRDGTRDGTRGGTPTKKGRREEGKKSKNQKGDRRSPDGADERPVDDPVVLQFPCRNGPGHLTRSNLDLLQSAYPRLDVLASCQAAMGWMGTAVPSSRWTTAGLMRGLRRWCQRDLDDGKNLMRVDTTGVPTKAAPVWTPEMRAAAAAKYGVEEER